MASRPSKSRSCLLVHSKCCAKPLDSEKAYKRKFEEWGLIKNIPKEEGLFMVKKRERRREEEGKETLFRRRRRPEGPLQPVLDEKVDRIADRYSHDLNSYPEHPGKDNKLV